MQHFNNLTPAQAERLAMLAEECGEVIQAVGKILRHGYDSYHPEEAAKFPENRQTNRDALVRELTDLSAVIVMIEQDAVIVSFDAVTTALRHKMRYTHCQSN
ncbi:MAG TPA: hypothetical protein DIT40_08855 [Alphaproteobacteria bacterium]|nr:hypothetical protein [Alphaproteobacteria bacterium]